MSALRDLGDIADLVAGNARIVDLLAAVAEQDLPDGWIAAGAIRTLIWNRLHGYDLEAHAVRDVDVIYFDPATATREADQDVRRRLASARPGIAWDVSNQARMHLRNGDQPYADCADAMRHFPETATAIAARLANGRIEVSAPFGIVDLLEFVVRPTPAFATRPQVAFERASSRGWFQTWQRLRFERAAVAPN